MKIKASNNMEYDVLSLTPNGAVLIEIIFFRANIADIITSAKNGEFDTIEEVDDNGAVVGVYNGYTEIESISMNGDLVNYTVRLVLKRKSVEDTITFIQQDLDNTVKEIGAIKETISPTVDIDKMTLDELQSYKKKDFNEKCQSIIYSGADVELSIGVQHFSFTDADQRNLSSLFQSAIATGLSCPYHQDGYECELYSPTDIVAIYFAMQSLITYNTTYNNLLGIMLKNATDIETVKSMEYGMDLTDELKMRLSEILVQAQSVMDTLVGGANESNQPNNETTTD